MKRVSVVLLAVGCTSRDWEVPRYGGDPLYSAPELEQAEDLGHAVAAVPDPGAAGPLQFEDVTEVSGLGLARGGGNQHGVGVGLLDLDGDDAPDLLIANGTSNVTGEVVPSLLYWNDGVGSFSDGTVASGVAQILDGLDTYSVAAGDVDRDGDVDVYIGAQPTNRLLLNEGGRRFVDGTGGAGAAGSPSDASAVGNGKGKVVSMGDLDGDGHLDLLSVSSTHDAPGVVVLWNRGDGTFDDVTERSGARIATLGNPCAVLLADYDNDGDPDPWIWNDRGGHTLLRNEGGLRFTHLGNAPDGVDIFNPMGIDAADIDHDGDLDFYVSNIGRHPLLLAQGDGRFVDATDAAGTRGDYGWGVGFEDFDLDGWADLYVTQEDDRPVLAYQNLRTTDPPTFRTVRLDRPLPVTRRPAAHNVAAAFADVDRDGRVDAFWATTDGSRPVLHRNVTDVGSHRGLEVRIARDAVGARVAVGTPDGLVQFRDLVGNASRASVSELSVRFGLGDYDGASWVGVWWSDGTHQAVINVPSGTVTIE